MCRQRRWRFTQEHPEYRSPAAVRQTRVVVRVAMAPWLREALHVLADEDYVTLSQLCAEGLEWYLFETLESEAWLEG